MAWDDEAPKPEDLRTARWDAEPPKEGDLPEVGGDPGAEIGPLWQKALTKLQKATGSLRSLTTGPLTGAALQAYSGKPVFSGGKSFSPWSDMGDALNPSGYKTFPSNADMMKRAGVKNPALSDAIPGAYAPKGKGEHFYTPEKGGWLDPTVGGTLEMASDPAMWTGAEELGAAGKALEAASPVARAKNLLAMPAKALGAVTLGRPIAKGIEMLPGGQWANTLANPISAATRAFGSGMYGAAIRPIEHEGEAVGKTEVKQTLRQAGVMNPFDVTGQIQKKANVIKGARDKIFQETADAGGRVDMREALAPGYAEVRRLRSLGSKSADEIADSLEEQLNHTVSTAEGIPPTPGTPPTYSSREVSSPILDEQGKPFTHSQTVQVDPGIPMDPGVPPQPYTPAKASELKTFMTTGLPNSTYKPALSTPQGARGMRNAASGLKREIENTVETKHPTASGMDIEDLNKNLGNLIGTKRSQLRVSGKADRDLDGIIRGTGMDAVVAGGVEGFTGDPLAAGKAVLLKKILRAMQLSAMPVGYGVQGLGNTNILDKLNQATQRQKQGGRQPQGEEVAAPTGQISGLDPFNMGLDPKAAADLVRKRSLAESIYGKDSPQYRYWDSQLKTKYSKGVSK